MSYKKGFTLVELLGVFVILSIIVLVTFPYATGLLRNTKDSEYERFEKNLFLAAEAYIEANSSNYEELKINGGLTYISLADLTEEGFVSEKMTNPKTKKEIDLNNSIKVTKTENGLSYELLSEDYSLNGYVQNGLILHYDGYKAPYKLENDYYWKDISGNQNDGILNNFDSNSGWQIDNIYFDGVNDYIKISTLDLSQYKDITIYASFSIVTNTEGATGIIGTSHTGNGRIFFGYSSSNQCSQNFLAPDTWINFNCNLENNKKYSMADVYKGTNTEKNNLIYLNGIFKIKDTTTMTTSWSTPDLVIGKAFGISNFLTAHPYANIKLYNIMIYNRALTQSEIIQNYKLDQKRYGI